MQNKKKLFLTALCTLAACVLPLLPLDKPVQARRYERIVVCSDIHYGSKTREPELRARKIAKKSSRPGHQRLGGCGPVRLYRGYGPENRQPG